MARILGESIDYSRQAQLAAVKVKATLAQAAGGTQPPAAKQQAAALEGNYRVTVTLLSAMREARFWRAGCAKT